MPGHVIAAWDASGRRFSAGGTTSFVAERGAGEPVVCVHGVPASAFLYRKVLDELAARGLRGIAFDLPGLGLADRPEGFDYTWTGLGRFCVDAVDALALDRFHLVVHDIGGPVGFELAHAMPDRIRSLTILNTIIEVDTFHRPWAMEPFARRGVGALWLRSMQPLMFRTLMGFIGVGDRSAVPAAELDAYVELLKRDDGGRAFLRIMRGFERTREKRQRYIAAVTDGRYPVHALWGARDPALPVDPYGEIARDLTGADVLDTVPAKHFLQEDQAPAIADRIARLAAQAS
jgi:pimeloyl-ACP methyl ester carboxylesterase